MAATTNVGSPSLMTNCWSPVTALLPLDMNKLTTKAIAVVIAKNIIKGLPIVVTNLPQGLSSSLKTVAKSRIISIR